MQSHGCGCFRLLPLLQLKAPHLTTPLPHRIPRASQRPPLQDDGGHALLQAARHAGQQRCSWKCHISLRHSHHPRMAPAMASQRVRAAGERGQGPAANTPARVARRAVQCCAQPCRAVLQGRPVQAAPDPPNHIRPLSAHHPSPAPRTQASPLRRLPPARHARPATSQPQGCILAARTASLLSSLSPGWPIPRCALQPCATSSRLLSTLPAVAAAAAASRPALLPLQPHGASASRAPIPVRTPHQRRQPPQRPPCYPCRHGLRNRPGSTTQHPPKPCAAATPLAKFKGHLPTPSASRRQPLIRLAVPCRATPHRGTHTCACCCCCWAARCQPSGEPSLALPWLRHTARVPGC